MLHNTGPYGPNEPPINMGAPVNMTPMSGHMNLAHNINNLSKVAHQGVPAASGHYNLPDYAHYNHQSLSMAPQMSQFPNYQHLGFQQSYINQNANSVNDYPFPSGMFPINMNMQTEHNANVMNYAYDKRLIESTRQESANELIPRKMPLNIPQLPNKPYNKQIGENNAYINNDYHESVHHNIDLSMKTQDKLQIDSTRRKNIENTVKLIEDILIHSSNQPKEPLKTPKEPTITKVDIPSDMTIEKAKTNNSISNFETTNEDPLALSPADLTIDDKCNDKSDDDHENPDTDHENPDSDNENPDSDNEKKELDHETSDDEDVKPVGVMTHTVQDSEVTTDNSIVIKVEKASWADSECFTPFLKDCHGFERDEHMNYRIIESETSVSEATLSYKNEIKPEGVFECPHCALLFKHPKRFLIHNKWHTFGLTNEKRMELAKVREKKRFERKEAKIIERMNSKEVTEGSANVDGKVFPCKDCDKVFSAKGSLKNHRQRSHPTGGRECKICHKPISSWKALRAHLATHSADSGFGFQCSLCPKRFKYAHSLAKHSDTHLEKIHACAECPKKFGSQALLKMHMKTHERVLRGATFRCTYCGKGFFESYSLQVHERTHRNERPYVCEICNTSFGTNSSLKRHVKVSHNSAKPHSCSVCHRNFSTQAIRERHELRLHANPDDFQFPCKLCPSKYLKLKELQKHVYKMHPKGKRKKKPKSDSE